MAIRINKRFDKTEEQSHCRVRYKNYSLRYRIMRPQK